MYSSLQKYSKKPRPALESSEVMRTVVLPEKRIESFKDMSDPRDPPSCNKSSKSKLTLTWKHEEHATTKKPEVSGPAQWFSYHNAAAHLPEVLSPVTAKRIANFIDGIPEMTPCDKCSEHARGYIEKHKELVNNFKTRKDVVKFFVDFHNFVNQRLGKPIVSVEDAEKMYRGGQGVKVLKYEYV